MSEREHGPHVPRNSAQDSGRQTARPSLPSATPAHQSQRRPASPRQSIDSSRRTSVAPSQGLELPPLSDANLSNRGGALPPAGRIAGVASILNPSEDDAQPGQRRKLSQVQSPAVADQRLPPLASSVHDTHSASRDGHISPRPPRRLLTPRSPSAMHRTASLGQLHPQAGIINAQQVPFPTSPHRHTAQPGRFGVPPLPTPPARLQATGYGFPPLLPQQEAARRASTGTNRARKPSPSASPTTSYSSYSQAEQTSPTGTFATSSGTPFPPAYAEAHRGGRGDVGEPDAQRQMGIPMSSSGGQNVYQIMTLETTSGTVQLPVDVQAASRVADEKRKRNAGASARFRQRRKEKEKEASTSIARLEQQVKELGDEAEFYRRDRAELLHAIRNLPGLEHLLQRPPSPQRMRGSIGSLPSSVTSRRASYMRPPESEPQSPETGRNVRRRTSAFSLPPSSQLPPPAGPPMQPNYPPAGYSAQGSQQLPAGALPPLSVPQQRQQNPGPYLSMQASPQPGPHNPYGRYGEPAPKEGR